METGCSAKKDQEKEIIAAKIKISAVIVVTLTLFFIIGTKER